MELLIIVCLLAVIIGLIIYNDKKEKENEEISRINYENSCKENRQWWKNLQDKHDENLRHL